MNSATTRRGFLKALATATLAAKATTQSSTVTAEEGPDHAGVDFGFSLYGMKSLKLSDAIQHCGAIGYDSIELVGIEGWPCDPAGLSFTQRVDLRKRIEDNSLVVSAIMEDLDAAVDADQHRKNLERLKGAAEVGHTVSPHRTPVIETVLGGQPNRWEALKGPLVERLKDWAAVAETAKTVIAVKAHISGALHTPGDAVWLTKEVGSPWLKLVYDYSHFQLREFALDESLKSMIDQTVFVHVKDTEGTKEKFRFLLPGDGKIDYPRYFAILKEANYNGSVMVEVSGQIHGQPGYDPIVAAKHCYANLAPKLAEAGIRREKKS